MSTEQSVTPVPATVLAMTKICEDVAQQHSLDRFEIAVETRGSATERAGKWSVQITQGIQDDNDLRRVDDMLYQIVTAIDTLAVATRPEIQRAHEAHKKLLAVAKSWHERWFKLKVVLGEMVVKYNQAKEGLQRKQQAELDKAAEAQRKRLEQEAQSAMRKGDVNTAMRVLEDAKNVVAPVIITAEPVLDHAQTQEKWRVEITDEMALVKAIAAGIIDIKAISEWDITFLKKEISKRGGLPAAWASAGIKAWQEDTLRVRR